MAVADDAVFFQSRPCSKTRQRRCELNTLPSFHCGCARNYKRIIRRAPTTILLSCDFPFRKSLTSCPPRRIAVTFILSGRLWCSNRISTMLFFKTLRKSCADLRGDKASRACTPLGLHERLSMSWRKSASTLKGARTGKMYNIDCRKEKESQSSPLSRVWACNH